MITHVSLDVDRFLVDLDDPDTQQAFREEVAEARSQGISGFPTLVFRNRSGQSIVVGGYRVYEAYEEVRNRLAEVGLSKSAPNQRSAIRD